MTVSRNLNSPKNIQKDNGRFGYSNISNIWIFEKDILIKYF